MKEEKPFWPVLITDEQAKASKEFTNKCFESDYGRLMSVEEKSEIKVDEHLDKLFKEAKQYGTFL